ncbi:MAG TPA: hypothetical protein VEZ47_04375 [Gemmatirosa sp.]|nr:hypothetical protein [Gemmatirosa sp.]
MRRTACGRLAALAVLVASVAAACQTPTAAGEARTRSGVRAEYRGGGLLRLSNATAAPVFSVVLGRRTAPLVLWGACVDAALCPPLAPGASREVAVDTVARDGARETEAIVYWWHAVPGADGRLRPDSIRSDIVGL